MGKLQGKARFQIIFGISDGGGREAWERENRFNRSSCRRAKRPRKGNFVANQLPEKRMERGMQLRPSIWGEQKSLFTRESPTDGEDWKDREGGDLGNRS